MQMITFINCIKDFLTIAEITGVSVGKNAAENHLPNGATCRCRSHIDDQYRFSLLQIFITPHNLDRLGSLQAIHPCPMYSITLRSEILNAQHFRQHI